jgi:hypothetical protein
MKTTLYISDSLYKDAKAVARRDGVTVQIIVERGLQLALAERSDRRQFRLLDASVAGNGLLPHAARITPAQLIDLSYQSSGD